MAPHPAPSAQEARYLRWIAILNLSKGVLLCLLGIGLLGFLHKDLTEIVKNCVMFFHFNTEGRHIVKFLAHVDKVTDLQLKEWSGITFAMGGVFVAEGVGLLLRQQWAKYLTLAFTSSFIPFEIYEVHQHPGWMRVAVLGVNVAIAAFLVVLLVHEKKRAHQSPTAAVSVPPRQPVVSCGPV